MKRKEDNYYNEGPGLKWLVEDQISSGKENEKPKEIGASQRERDEQSSRKVCVM